MGLFGRKPNNGTERGFFARFRRPVTATPNRRRSPMQVANAKVVAAQRNLVTVKNNQNLIRKIQQHKGKNYDRGLQGLQNAINRGANNSNIKMKLRMLTETALGYYGPDRANAVKLAKILNSASDWYTYNAAEARRKANNAEARRKANNAEARRTAAAAAARRKANNAEARRTAAAAPHQWTNAEVAALPGLRYK